MTDLDIRDDESMDYRILLDRIADAAVDVRIHQKEYNRTRGLPALSRKKQAEKEIDLLIAQRAQMLAGRGQYKERGE